MRTTHVRLSHNQEVEVFYAKDLLLPGTIVNVDLNGTYLVGAVISSLDDNVPGNGNAVVSTLDMVGYKRRKDPAEHYDDLEKALTAEIKKIPRMSVAACLVGVNPGITEVVMEIAEFFPERLPLDLLKNKARCIPVEQVLPLELVDLIRAKPGKTGGIKVFDTVNDIARLRRTSISSLTKVNEAGAKICDEVLRKFGLDWQPPVDNI